MFACARAVSLLAALMVLPLELATQVTFKDAPGSEVDPILFIPYFLSETQYLCRKPCGDGEATCGPHLEHSSRRDDGG